MWLSIQAGLEFIQNIMLRKGPLFLKEAFKGLNNPNARSRKAKDNQYN